MDTATTLDHVCRHTWRVTSTHRASRIPDYSRGTMNPRLLAVLGAAGLLCACSDRQSANAPTAPSFNAAAQPARDYVPRDLGSLAGTFSQALDINNRGQIVGETDVTSGRHGFIWTEARGMVALPTLGGTYSTPAELNDLGVIVGWAGDAATNAVHAVRWTNGRIEQLLPPDVASLGVSINDAGDIIGCYQPNPDRFEFRPFLLPRQGGMRDLGSLGNGAEGFGCGESINNRGDVAGRSPEADGRQGSFIWTAQGGMRDIGNMAGGQPFAYAINDRDEVVGWEDNAAPNGSTRAFIWTTERGFTDLGTLSFAQNARAFSINSRGEVVGESWNGAEDHLFIWTRDVGMRDLGVAPGQTRSGAIGINERGDIVGWADVPGSEKHAVLWQRR